MPLANITSATDRLFVMMALDASGLTARMECVHISRRSIVSIIVAGSSSRSKPGFDRVRIAPATPVARKMPSAAAVYGSVSRNTAGKTRR